MPPKFLILLKFFILYRKSKQTNKIFILSLKKQPNQKFLYFPKKINQTKTWSVQVFDPIKTSYTLSKKKKTKTKSQVKFLILSQKTRATKICYTFWEILLCSLPNSCFLLCSSSEWFWCHSQYFLGFKNHNFISSL